MTTQTAESLALALMADTTVYELEVNACNAAAMLRSQAAEIESLTAMYNRFVNSTNAMREEHSVMASEIDRLRSATLSVKQIEQILHCLNTPEQANLRLVLRDLYKVLDAARAALEPKV